MKKAFTLVELSVVIVIISILLTSILVSRILVDSSRINSIYQEYRAFDNSIKIFKDAYDCLPGDCRVTQIPDLINKSFPANCVTEGISLGYTSGSNPNISTLQLNTSYIDSSVKRSCAMYALNVAGFIESVDKNYNSVTELQHSISGKNMPFSKYNKLASWDLRAIIRYGGLGQQDAYIGYSAFLTEEWWPRHINNHLLTLRNSNTDITDFSADIGGGDEIVAWTPNAKAGLTSNLMKKLDSKYDDGTPYGGDIVGGIPNSSFGNNNNPSPNCNSIGTLTYSTIATYNQLFGATYNSSNSLELGCLAQFLITTNVT